MTSTLPLPPNILLNRSVETVYKNYLLHLDIPYGVNFAFTLPIGVINFEECTAVYMVFPGNDTSKPPIFYNLVNRQGQHYRTIAAQYVLFILPFYEEPTRNPINPNADSNFYKVN